MSFPADFLRNFSGMAPLFPLTNVVLFPHVMQPLYLFEPRYVEMIQDVLEGERMMAMALIRPGGDPAGQPALFPVVCLGRVLFEQKLQDGKFQLVLQGLCRAQMLGEQPQDKLYRCAHLELLQDDVSALVNRGVLHEQQLRERLQSHLRRLVPSPQVPAEFERLLAAEVPLQVLSDILGFTAGFSPVTAQELLQEMDVLKRVDHLLSLLATFPGQGRKSSDSASPPSFSLN